MSTRILAGRYELLERIGDGGMAVVYKARCRLLNRFVAIKILKPDFIKDIKFIENFKKESQAAASLSHPNIVNVYDVGREGNIHYIVMELIEGKVLSDVIEEEAPLDYMRSIDITKQIASALSFAHKNQIIHRDVKPHNILITQNGTAKITDFGIAKAVTVNAETLVGNEGTVMGSVHYFSPEQARGGYVDEKSDIYSLGIVLYEMLTGKVPFDGDNPVSVALMHVNDEMTPPSQLVEGIPPRLEQIVLKATDKIQVNRYKSAVEMFDALSNLEYVTSIVGDSAVGGIRRLLNNNQEDQTEEKRKEELEEMSNKGKPGKGKKKFKVNKIKLLAVALALLCAIPVSIFIASAITGIGEAKEVSVPDLIGLTIERAEEELAKCNLMLQTGIEVYSSEYDEGRIVSQDPMAESNVKEGKTVVVNISKGTNQGAIPKITGRTREDAEFTIKKYGYKVGLGTPVKNDLPKGLVISQDPEAGTEAKPGATINFTVSEGKEVNEAIMPNVIGQDISLAREAIEKAGLKLDSKPEYETSEIYEINQVMWQEHKAGKVLEAGTPVKLKISSGKESNVNSNTPGSVQFEISYAEAQNQILLLTVYVTDETGTHDIITSEQRLKDNGGETLTLTGVGSGTVTVIFDDQMVMRKNIDFTTGEIN